MNVTLRLEALLDERSSDDAIAQAAAWLEALDYDPPVVVERSEESPLLVAELHPAAEPIEISATESGRLAARAKSSTAGPGYHRWVCSTLEALGESLGLTWEAVDDETGWFQRRDEDELEGVFLDWLGAAISQVRELAAGGARGFALALPAGHAFSHDDLVATPLGPRDEAWVNSASEDPRAGRDAFPFWERHGTASYFRGLALARMWTDVRWRAPLDEQERALMEQIVTWIERAHGIDPTVSLPWREQSELFELLGEESLRATRAHVKAEASPLHKPIGYRRRPVRAQLSGGWWLTIPGEMAERWEERGTWVAWDAKRSVWFTSMTVHRSDGSPTEGTEDTLAHLPPLEGDEILELERDELHGFASFHVDEDDGGTLHHRLEAHAAVAHHAAVGTLVYIDPSDREWALTTWGSLDRGR